MIKAMFSAATGMDAQQTRIAVISNNIANMNTTGFKASRAEFQDLIYETRQLPGTSSSANTANPAGIQIGSGTSVVSTQPLFTQGTLEQTAKPLDVAIEGEGFFKITVPSGTAYTRSGSFSVDSSGQLVTQSGFPVDPSITVTQGTTDVAISIDGKVTGRVNGGSTVTEFGTLTLNTFANPAGLESVGRNLYKETAASGAPQTGTPGTNGVGTLQQGFLEGSNVNIAEELIRMILAQRAYEMNGKVITTSDQMLSSTTALR